MAVEIQSAVLGNVTLRREYSQSDDQQITRAGKMLREDSLLDIITAQGAQQYLEAVDAYFQAHRDSPVTIENIYRVVNGNPQCKWFSSPAEKDWYDAADSNPQLGNDLANYLASTSGRPGQLVKDGSDLHFENLTLLFQEINSRREQATQQSISNAENRIANRAQKQLHRIPTPRRTEPVSPAARSDDGSPFLGADLVPDGRGGLRSKTPAEQRREREAAEAAANQSTARERLSEEESRWKAMAESCLNFGTHGQQEAIRQVFNQTSGSWRQRFEAVNRVVNMYKRGAAVRGWGGR